MDWKVCKKSGHRLLLIRTNLGCGTVLMAACAHQGCNVTDYFIIMAKFIYCLGIFLEGLRKLKKKPRQLVSGPKFVGGTS
jgi:hypothetical protein